MKKKQRVLEIADELDKLGYPGVAQMLRDAVTSGKTETNAESTTEGGEEDGEEGEDGGNHPKKGGGN